MPLHPGEYADPRTGIVPDQGEQHWIRASFANRYFSIPQIRLPKAYARIMVDLLNDDSTALRLI